MVGCSPSVMLPLQDMFSLVWCFFACASGEVASVPAALQASNFIFAQVAITSVAYFVDLNEFKKSLWQFKACELQELPAQASGGE